MFCLEKTSLHPTLGLHGHSVVSLCLSSWEHPQTAESWKFPFPLCQKDLNAPFRARSSHHITGQGCPAGTETHFKLRGAQRRSEGSSAPFPPSPELCTVTRQLCQETPARCKKDTGQDGWGYSGESCSQSPLPFHFRYIHNGASCLQGYRARLSRFQTSETSPIGRAEGSPPAFKSGGWNWGPPASLRQVTEMVLQPGDTGPHQEVGSPRSGSCFSKHPRCWFETESLSRRDYNT